MKSVAELHAEHPVDWGERSWGYNTSLEDAVAMADELHTQPDPVAYLDTMLMRADGSSYNQAKAINRALLFLPPEVVYENFGEELAVWISSNGIVMGDNDGINKVLEARGGYDLEDLEVSRLWQWNQYYNSQGKPISANYQLMQSIKNGALDKLDLPSLLQQNAKPDVTLSEKRLADYALMAIPLGENAYNPGFKGGWTRDWAKQIDDDTRYDVWLDAPIGFALMYRGLPNALAGLAMRGNDEIMIHQIQGIRGSKVDSTKRFTDEYVIGQIKSRGLAPIDWKKLLVDATEQIGENAGVKRLGIQAAKNNVWCNQPKSNAHHLPLEVGEATYDQTAKRLGFSRSPGDTKDNWHKEIQALALL